jgi:hypothetical protein
MISMHFVETKPDVGYWLFPGSDTTGPATRFYMPVKPPWWNRFCMKYLLGFIWVDINA